MKFVTIVTNDRKMVEWETEEIKRSNEKPTKYINVPMQSIL